MGKIKGKDALVVMSVSDLKKLIKDREKNAQKDILSRVKGYLKKSDWDSLESYFNKKNKGQRVLSGHAKGNPLNSIRVTMGGGNVPKEIKQYIYDE
jgi:hypothetical protein